MYLPHCPKALYASLLQHNFGPDLGHPGRLLLGNDLSQYVLDVQAPSAATTDADGFAKTKKKRRGKATPGGRPKDGVLERLGE